MSRSRRLKGLCSAMLFKAAIKQAEVELFKKFILLWRTAPVSGAATWACRACAIDSTAKRPRPEGRFRADSGATGFSTLLRPRRARSGIT
jgi:hypothetical protein